MLGWVPWSQGFLAMLKLSPHPPAGHPWGQDRPGLSGLQYWA